ncbi:hypothetical protein NC652_039076 [Populus alba x Populus x berolinensis]|nr:hypothetical protein NC652_039076 [Populus alba x Populus x berolinensis]
MDKGKAVMGSGRRWAVDFTDNSTTPSSRDIPDPPGFNRASQEQDDSAVTKQKKDAEANWKSQKAWEVAQAPFKNLLMMGFMMWMAGNTVHLFSIGITFSALWQPIGALQGVGKVFEPYKDSKVDLLAPKLIFIALNLGGLALGIWKLNTLGLLPTHVSDWVSSLPPAKVVVFLCADALLLYHHSPSGGEKEVAMAGPDSDLFLDGGLLFMGVVTMTMYHLGCFKFLKPIKHNRLGLPTTLSLSLYLVIYQNAPMDFTADQLLQYNGTNPSNPIYVAIKGRVFDVTTGKSFYGPGGSYAMFAGKDASRALAKMSKNDEDITSSLHGLTEKEIGVLDDWEKKFEAKYPVVGRVVS